MPTIVDHYAAALPLLERHFGGVPVVPVAPQGEDARPHYGTPVRDVPPDVATIVVPTLHGPSPYVRLTGPGIAWLVRARGAYGFDAWTPLRDDPARAAYGRIRLAPHGRATAAAVTEAARVLRERLAAEGVAAVPIAEGFRSVTLWLPFDDAPSYAMLARWLSGIATRAAAARPDLLTVAPRLADRGDRIYLGTKSNHVGIGSLLPYCVHDDETLAVALPLGWDELDAPRGEVTVATFAAYLAAAGDAFARERERIGPQRLGDRGDARETMPSNGIDALDAPIPSPKGYIIEAALVVLADGAAHDADDIVAQALAKGLLPPSTSRKYVYTALHEYVERTLGAGRVPELLQIAGTSTFRLNRPADPWPAIALPPLPTWRTTAQIDAAIETLRATATGGDPAAFEVAACDAFAALGYLAEHVGGNGRPDGILTAPLGRAGYRAILECKTASPGEIVANPRPEEPAKFRADAGATYALLLGPAFGNDASFDDELAQHGVACWTVEDLATALRAQIGPDELVSALGSGRATRTLGMLLWERDHGRRKRVAVLAATIARVGWRLQTTLARGVAPDVAPPLTEDALLLLVDEALVADGVTSGATIDEARDALATLEVAGSIRRFESGYVVRLPQELAARTLDSAAP